MSHMKKCTVNYEYYWVLSTILYTTVSWPSLKFLNTSWSFINISEKWNICLRATSFVSFPHSFFLRETYVLLLVRERDGQKKSIKRVLLFFDWCLCTSILNKLQVAPNPTIRRCVFLDHVGKNYLRSCTPDLACALRVVDVYFCLRRMQWFWFVVMCQSACPLFGHGFFFLSLAFS